MHYEFNPYNKVGLNNELTLLQVNPDCAAQLEPKHAMFGWLYTRHPDGHWVTLRKLHPLEVEEAQEQAADFQVVNGTRVRAG